MDALGNEIRGLEEDETSRLVEGVCAPAVQSSERRLNSHVGGRRAALVEKHTLIINDLIPVTRTTVMPFPVVIAGEESDHVSNSRSHLISIWMKKKESGSSEKKSVPRISAVSY